MRRQAYQVHSPIDVRCPYCKMPPGLRCINKRRQTISKYHQKRLDAFDIWFMEMTQEVNHG